MIPFSGPAAGEVRHAHTGMGDVKMSSVMSAVALRSAFELFSFFNNGSGGCVLRVEFVRCSSCQVQELLWKEYRSLKADAFIRMGFSVSIEHIPMLVQIGQSLAI